MKNGAKVKTKSKSKRNPQDATLRNIRALKKRVRILEIAVICLIRKTDSFPARKK